MSITAYIIPIIIAIVFIFGLIKKVNVFDEFIEGAKENLEVGISILPTLIAIMTAIGMFKASGALDLISDTIAPLVNLIGFPKECVPLALIRPVSGSGALAVYESVLNGNPPDSYVGRVASVLLGSTETTFYTIAVYYSVTKVRNIRHSVICSLAGDLTGFICSSLLVKYIFFQ